VRRPQVQSSTACATTAKPFSLAGFVEGFLIRLSVEVRGFRENPTASLEMNAKADRSKLRSSIHIVY
jgi:hypothetical protein